METYTNTDTKPYKPTPMFLLVMWSILGGLAAAQGYFTGEAVMTVLSWFGYH